MFDELKGRLSLIASLEDYHFVIGVRDGEAKSDLYKISNSTLFYIYDNGSPRRGILPKNISTEFHYWFLNTLVPQLEEKLIDGIINRGWKQSNILSFYESKCRIIEEWFRTHMKSQNILDIDMDEYSKNIYCKIIFENI